MPDNTGLIVLAVGVGIIGGCGAVALHHFIELMHRVFFETFHVATGSPLFLAQLVLSPMLGALLAASLVYGLARHDKTHGTASVMEAIALHNGRLKERPMLVDIVASGVLIGAGGSAGPEDSSVQVGAVGGSATARTLRFTGKRATTLVTAGVASAIAAIFNAPIAGVFFALEIVAGDFSAALLVPVVLAAVAGSIVGRAMLGNEASFAVPPYTLVAPFIETPLYALLGVIAAVVGVLLIRTIFVSASLFERIPLVAPLRAAVGGLLVGLIALLFWQSFGVEGILGVGYETSSSILLGDGPAGWLLLALLVGKFIAVAITIGAVRVGGTFAPSLVLGAMVGGLFGQVVNMLLPSLTAPPAAFALVGMGAVLNAVVRAPLTIVLMLFEMTGDYHIILAIMASVVTSQLTAHWLHSESIYTERLARKGIQLRFGRDVNLLELVTVGEVMTTRPDTVPHTMPLNQLEAEFERTHHHGFPVVDGDGALYGIVTITDVKEALERGIAPSTPVSSIATCDLVVVYPDQSLNVALRQLAIADVGRLPVVDQRNHHKLLGLVRRTDIVKAYQRGATRRTELEHRYQQMQVGSQSGAHIVELTLPDDAASNGRAVRDLHLPDGTIITAIRRQGQPIIPRGATVLQAGDEMTMLVSPDHAEQVRACVLTGGDDADADDGLRYHEIALTANAPAVGKPVAHLDLPAGVLIITLQRAGNTHVVHGDTVLQAHDTVVVLSPPEALPAAAMCLSGEH